MTSLYEPAQNGEVKNCGNCKHSKAFNSPYFIKGFNVVCLKLFPELNVSNQSNEKEVMVPSTFYCSFHERK